MTYKFCRAGKMIEPKDNGMKRYCKHRPNYLSIRLPSGDYQIFRAWMNSKGKPAQTIIYASVGSSDHEAICRELTRQAKEHFSIRLYQCEQNSYMKYALTWSSIYSATEEIRTMKKTIGSFPVHEPTRQEYLSRLQQWLDTKFTFEKDRFYQLINLYEDVNNRCHAWNYIDFLALQERTAISEQEYNEKLFTLKSILKSLQTIRLFERLRGYYLKADAIAMNEE